jgi:hypothetical protein
VAERRRHHSPGFFGRVPDRHLWSRRECALPQAQSRRWAASLSSVTRLRQHSCCRPGCVCPDAE